MCSTLSEVQYKLVQYNTRGTSRVLAYCVWSTFNAAFKKNFYIENITNYKLVGKRAPSDSKYSFEKFKQISLFTIERFEKVTVLKWS